MYKRKIYQKIVNSLYKGSVILLYGARQVGKTTICKQIVSENGGIYLHCETNLVSSVLASKNIDNILNIFENKKLVVLDEAQTITGIGSILKLLYDTHPEIQIIATGSSSFYLANKTGEPLVGRSLTYNLYPLSVAEIIEHDGFNSFYNKLDTYLQYGLMPGVVNSENKEQILSSLTTGYLYKDILTFENVKNPDLLNKILKTLALQVGSQVSLREIASLLQTTHQTVQRYIELLEKTFVIYRLKPFSKNLRNEINSGFKVYFYDIGFRNWLIDNTNLIDNRADKGGLWENFCINERLKDIDYNDLYSRAYFWRTYDGLEVDLLEVRNENIQFGRLNIIQKKQILKYQNF
jgi:uncharacterized protein